MISWFGRGVRLCDGITRREALRVGGLGFTGLMWSDLLRARRRPHAKPAAGRFGKAKACILIFNYGGPSHLDIWDLKPDAPAEIRGEFKPIATARAGRLDHRTPAAPRPPGRPLRHRPLGHPPRQRPRHRRLPRPDRLFAPARTPSSASSRRPRPQDMPSLGSVVSKLRPADKPVFPYVTLGDLRHFGNNDSMGQNAGCLGKVYDPFTVPFVRPMNGTLDLGGVTLRAGGGGRPAPGRAAAAARRS